MKNIAVVLAGGSGRRFGAEKPKQFLVVAGSTILEHTLSKFDKHPDITGICLVVHPDYMSEASLIIENAGFSKPVTLLAGERNVMILHWRQYGIIIQFMPRKLI